jgi:hypothetical protein
MRTCPAPAGLFRCRHFAEIPYAVPDSKRNELGSGSLLFRDPHAAPSQPCVVRGWFRKHRAMTLDFSLTPCSSSNYRTASCDRRHQKDRCRPSGDPRPCAYDALLDASRKRTPKPHSEPARERPKPSRELAPPDGRRRICWVLELCGCHAFARHARHLTDHRLEVNADLDGEAQAKPNAGHVIIHHDRARSPTLALQMLSSWRSHHPNGQLAEAKSGAEHQAVRLQRSARA